MLGPIKFILIILKYINVWRLPSRINRTRYILLNSIYSYPIAALFSIALIFEIKSLFLFAIIITLVAILTVLIPLMVKRVHDFNFRGWWLLMLFIPYINGILVYLPYFIPGTKKENKFGSVPQRRSRFEEIFAIILVGLLILNVVLSLIFHKNIESLTLAKMFVILEQ